MKNTHENIRHGLRRLCSKGRIHSTPHGTKGKHSAFTVLCHNQQKEKHVKPRPKKSSDTLADARLRLNSIASIDPNLDLGGGVNVEAYRQIVNETTVALDNYNTKLGEVDTAHDVYGPAQK